MLTADRRDRTVANTAPTPQKKRAEKRFAAYEERHRAMARRRHLLLPSSRRWLFSTLGDVIDFVAKWVGRTYSK